jgi:hypothetical protein
MSNLEIIEYDHDFSLEDDGFSNDKVISITTYLTEPDGDFVIAIGHLNERNQYDEDRLDELTDKLIKLWNEKKHRIQTAMKG